MIWSRDRTETATPATAPQAAQTAEASRTTRCSARLGWCLGPVVTARKASASLSLRRAPLQGSETCTDVYWSLSTCAATLHVTVLKKDERSKSLTKPLSINRPQCPGYVCEPPFTRSPDTCEHGRAKLPSWARHQHTGTRRKRHGSCSHGAHLPAVSH